MSNKNDLEELLRLLKSGEYEVHELEASAIPDDVKKALLFAAMTKQLRKYLVKPANEIFNSELSELLCPKHKKEILEIIAGTHLGCSAKAFVQSRTLKMKPPNDEVLDELVNIIKEVEEILIDKIDKLLKKEEVQFWNRTVDPELN